MPENTSSPSQKGSIFISYRRMDSAGYAGRIYDRLVASFGEGAIFMDVDTIEGGTDFIKVLEEAVQSCDVLIALIGRQWLSTRDKAGERRLDNPEDFVRIEIATALKRNIRVIPVLVDGAELPQSTELPENLKALARRNALQVNHHSFNSDAHRLIEHSKSALAEAEGSRVLEAQALRAANDKAAREKAQSETAEKEQSEKIKKSRLPGYETSPVDQPTPEEPKDEEPQTNLRKLLHQANRRTTLTLIGFAGIVIIAFLNSPIFATWRSSDPTPTTTLAPIASATASREDAFTATAVVLVTQTTSPVPTETPTPLPIEITDVNKITMRFVPAGQFIMGSERQSDEQPIHKVNLPSFYMDIYEVTLAHYNACVLSNACKPTKNAISDAYYNHPVIYVDWNQAKTYCEWRGARLPTEAEWEKAARGTNGQTYPWGEDMVDGSRVNFCDNNCLADWKIPHSDDGYAGTAPVGIYPSGKSPYGIYDLAGNVWEWVADWYSDSYYQNSPVSNPLGPNIGEYRVIRGASWLNIHFAGEIVSSNRGRLTPGSSTNDLGFRCAKDTTP